MFSNNSSSLEISSVANGSTQNLEGNGVDVTCGAGQLAEPALTTCGNELATKEESFQFGSNIPTEPVPDMRDSNDCTNDRPGDVGNQASSMSTTSLVNSVAAQSTTIESTMQDGLFSKDALPSAVPSLSASEVATCSRSLVKPLHTGCDPCGCCNHHPDDNCASCSKSEACSHVCSHQNTTQSSVEDVSGGPLVKASQLSVISSSSGMVVATEMEFLPPSDCTSSGAHQSTPAVFACDLDSSSSNKLQLQCFEPSKASGNALPIKSKQHHQNQIMPAAETEFVKQNPGHLIPSWERKLTTGALSDQDNNYNKANHSNNSVKEHSPLGGGDAKHSHNAWSQTPFNIPEAKGDGNSHVPQAIQATVQGINDSSNPPASFNNNVNVYDYDNVNDKGTAPALDMSTALLSDYACMNLPSDKDPEAHLPSKKKDVPYNTTGVVMNQNKDFMKKVKMNAMKPEENSGIMIGPASNARWGIPQGLGLRGGGESSLNNGTTGWGTPPGGNNNSNNNSSNSNNNPGANSAAAAGWGSANSTPNAGNNPGGQAQWGAPNNNRPNTGNNQNAVVPPNAGQSPSQTNAPGQPAPPAQPGPPGQPNPPTAPQQQTPPGQPQPQPNPSQPPPTSQPPPQNGSNPWSGGEMGPNQPPPPGGPPSSNNGNNGAVPGGLPPASGAGTPAAPSTKQQLEQLNTMREALFSQDGWGGQNVNQDTGWDIPSSPEPVTKDNNGTDLWEANLRNGGQPPPQAQQKTPWGHTPTTNIGGTWGEDDEVSDSSNMWTGVPSNPGPGVGPGPQWGAGGPGGPGGPGPGPAGGMWGGPKKDDWNRGNSNWGEPRGDPRAGDPRMGMDAMDPRDMRGVGGVGGGMDPRDMRGGSDPRDMRGVDMRADPMRGPMDPMRDGLRDPRDLRGMADMRGGDPMMRGDPRGISGRLNGGVNDPSMWGQPPQPPHHNMPHHQQSQPPRVGPGVGSGGNFPGGVNQWAGPPPKDMGMPGAGSKPSGWEEPSPPAQRRNIPNYDDGTSLWGQQQNRGVGAGGKVSHWKDMPTPNMGRSMQGCPPGMPQNRMPGSNAGNMKPDGPLWSHPGRNGSWDGPHDGSSGNPWVEDPKGGLGGMNNWNEPPLTPSSWGGPKPKNPMNPGGWMDGDMDASWGQPPKSGPKPIAKEMIWASKQFRMLTEMNFKKEDVENALRVSNMNLENALEMLNASSRMNMDAWRGHEDHGFDIGGSGHPGSGSGSAFSARGFPHSAPPIPFAPPGGPGLNNQPSLVNMNNANPSLTNISPALVQKMLMQQPPPQPPSQQAAPFNQSQRNSQNQPSAQQLQMLVKQIQMAVGAGYLNQQILNQPLSPQTLLLLNQLLQQIKVLQNLTQQHAVASAQKGNPAVLHISVQLTKTKQQISNLQNQIQAQQAMYVKHMPQQAPNQDYFKPNMHDPMIPNFGDLSISKEPQVMNDQSFQSQQSRLNQWKLPSLDKDPEGLGNEFSRAPGTTSKAPGLSQSHSSPNINPILSQGDGPWASRSNSDTGWPDSGSIESGQPDKDWPITSQSNSFSDLVPEFEPGKPWKGNQLKSIEDDPSITPGSVVRSPLSLAALKEPEMFSSGGVSKTSPTSSGAEILPPLSLSSSTWSYNNTASSTASSFASPLSKLGSKGPWGDGPVPTAVTSELWGAPQSKPRGPPPGLSSKNPNGNGGGNGGGGAGGAGGAGQGGQGGTASSGSSSSSSNGWGRGGGGTGSGGASSWGIQGGAGATPGAGTTGTAGWGSTWLLLKNLTPQIDGSTLKTLCLQHGPLLNFHLYLNHGIALAKYQSREEANKAQAALNNCVLSNTTIFAEAPSESEVHNLLSHLGHGTTQQQQSGASAPNWGMRSSSGGAGANSGAPPAPGKAPQSSQDTWGSSGGSNSSQLWASTPTSSVLWGSSPMDSSGDQHRATPSAFLPGDLLGGESM